ncbi:hypothetical protein H4S07_006858 [Coemansia furcata]|uniref:Uncharacterized protein n=1 Tax=Coemansia furcata TaxID=417177 RepID=A0ACC1KSW1_9FUNG|nr:hypothetical protein H4S07_006858 [Coemansia furcata]
MSRDPTSATQLNSYWLMSRAHQQKQQQPHADHLASISSANHQQSPATTLSSLPPMNHNGDMLPGVGRRLEELQLNQYQGMNSWNM